MVGRQRAFSPSRSNQMMNLDQNKSTAGQDYQRAWPRKAAIELEGRSASSGNNSANILQTTSMSAMNET